MTVWRMQKLCAKGHMLQTQGVCSESKAEANRSMGLRVSLQPLGQMRIVSATSDARAHVSTLIRTPVALHFTSVPGCADLFVKLSASQSVEKKVPSHSLCLSKLFSQPSDHIAGFLLLCRVSGCGWVRAIIRMFRFSCWRPRTRH